MAIGYARELPDNAVEPDWQDTPQSSWMLRYRYFDTDDGFSVVQIWFKDKAGNPTVCCEYRNVPLWQARELDSWASKGKAVHAYYYHLPYQIVA